jgi:hypothetical protein
VRQARSARPLERADVFDRLAHRDLRQSPVHIVADVRHAGSKLREVDLAQDRGCGEGEREHRHAEPGGQHLLAVSRPVSILEPRDRIAAAQEAAHALLVVAG